MEHKKNVLFNMYKYGFHVVMNVNFTLSIFTILQCKVVKIDNLCRCSGSRNFSFHYYCISFKLYIVLVSSIFYRVERKISEKTTEKVLPTILKSKYSVR